MLLKFFQWLPPESVKILLVLALSLLVGLEREEHKAKRRPGSLLWPWHRRVFSLQRPVTIWSKEFMLTPWPTARQAHRAYVSW